MPTEADKIFREFNRYTGDGKQGEPVGAPLPIGDPASGVAHIKKREIRDWANNFVFDQTSVSDLEAADAAADGRITALEGIAVSGAIPREAVALATTGNITLTGEKTIDGTLTSASAVFVWKQDRAKTFTDPDTGATDSPDNGVYITAGGAWTRRGDMDVAGEVQRSSVYVNGGTVNGGSTFYTGSEVTTLGTDPIVWQWIADQSDLASQISENRSAIEESDIILRGVEVYTDLQGRLVTVFDADGVRRVLEVQTDDIPTTSFALSAYGYDQTGIQSVETIPDYPSYPTFMRVVLDENGNRRVIEAYGPLLDYVAGGGRLTGGSGEAGVSYVSARMSPLKSGFFSRTAITMVLWYGQSLSVGADAQPALSLTQPWSNVTFGGGPKATVTGTTALKPLVEDDLTGDGTTGRGETPVSSSVNMVSELIALEDGDDPNDTVLLGSTAGHGGYTIAQLSEGGTWFQRLKDHVTGAKARADELGVTISMPVVCWLQGTSDGQTTSVSEYAASLVALQESVETFVQTTLGQTDPVIFLLFNDPGYTLPDGIVARAMNDVIDAGSGKFFWGMPHYRFFGSMTGGLHPTLRGYQIAGKYAGVAVKRIIIDGVEPPSLRVKSVTARGTRVSVALHVPQRPVVFDPLALPAAVNNGFSASDGAGELTLSEMEIVDGDKIEFTVNRALGANPIVDYAITKAGAGFPAVSSAAGCVRDSTQTKSQVSSGDVPLWHALVPFRKPIIILP
ncbi:hypothetical protein [Oceaniovalibus sp. ACAM 378]|uniref:hypothetical protein n=1 Tax=Oceaniovalibus sp. ACAM 378 TaxID=2599923 RepID=UPI0011D9A5E6|nr:hypothetical protein [Oceaniovalibus sp. ACAM 378]TYB83933.1 hypothetical protein FQ320_23540 [Oceaniovalibus sp. ACAM 378]